VVNRAVAAAVQPGADAVTVEPGGGAAPAAVTVPKRAGDKVIVAGEAAAVGIGLPRTTGRPAVRQAGGTVVFAEAAKPADIAVQPTGDGARVLINIKKATAHREYQFPVDVPAGGRLVSAAELLGADFDTGEIFVADAAGALVGGFERPWARDANGAPVPTSYRIEGNTVVQTIDFTARSAFPVVADPSFFKVLKCAASIALVLGTTVFVAAKIIRIKKLIKALGGLREGAKLLLRASTAEERLRVGGTALVEFGSAVLGVDGIIRNCRP
jgi:hypothetical protein